ncbi:MAG: hypothetical protein B2I17_06970 [Thermoplasmatales archaeon B_DKE]|nr:MAG: hypothetical protein B2I17_06970 [Thermoplasmatales archaeon B_DKE]QRF74673.1 acyl-CoA thioesterase YbgC [Thermoplasmatales archaeon]
MPEHKSTVELQLRYGDMDTLGHVNNAVYLTYFELGRIDLLKKHDLLNNLDEINFVIARAEIDYRKAITLFSNPVLETYIGKTGNTSVSFEHVIYEKGSGDIYCEGRTVAVFLRNGKKENVPDAIRAISNGHAGAML